MNRRSILKLLGLVAVGAIEPAPEVTGARLAVSGPVTWSYSRVIRIPFGFERLGAQPEAE